MKSPAQVAQAVEERPVLPPCDCERVSRYGVMGLPFTSGHVLGLRRWTASSVGDRFTSIWDPPGAGRSTSPLRARSRAIVTLERMYSASAKDPLTSNGKRPTGCVSAHLTVLLGVGKVQLTGTTSNRQHFDANPQRIWYVTASHAVVEGEALGPIGHLAEQAHMADFYFPQRGVFALGRVFISPLKETRNRTDPAIASP